MSCKLNVLCINLNHLEEKKGKGDEKSNNTLRILQQILAKGVDISNHEYKQAIANHC